MIMLQRWPFYWKENGHVTEVANLQEGEWSCYRGGQFKGGRMVMLRRCKFNGGSGHGTEVARLRENGHVTEMVTLMKREGPYYRGGQFKEGRMVMLWRWCLMEGA